MAAFLMLEGLTGSILVFREPLEQWLAPEFFARPRPQQAPLALAALARAAEQAAPEAEIGYFSVEARQAVFHIHSARQQVSGEMRTLDYDRLFLDPWTGKELGRRRDGDLSEGRANLVPFVFHLHLDLLAGQSGTWILGVVAVAWTFDCFLGLFLTCPTTLARFLPRWALAWRIKPQAGPVRRNFDLHRSLSLWLWPLLFVLAWSSVMFTLPEEVYAPVTARLFDFRSESDLYSELLRARVPNHHPRLDWGAAQDAGQHWMQEAAVRNHLHVGRPYGMAYLADIGVYAYAVTSDRNIQARAWTTSLWLDADTGALVDVELPSGEHAGNTAGNWLRALHFADVHDLLAYRILVCFAGIAVTALSVTGLYLWLKKRGARRYEARRLRAQAVTPLH